MKKIKESLKELTEEEELELLTELNSHQAQVIHDLHGIIGMMKRKIEELKEEVKLTESCIEISRDGY